MASDSNGSWPSDRFPGAQRPPGPGAMHSDPAERRRQSARSRRPESGQERAEPRGNRPRSEVSSGRSSGQDRARLEQVKPEEEPGTGSRREAGAGGEEPGRLRLRVHVLEKEKLELTSSHNQEVCRLQTELTRLRSSVERGEAQRVELQYQLTLSRRDGDRASQLSRDKQALTETVQELQRDLDVTRLAQDQDRVSSQQEVEERDQRIQNLSSENQRLHRVLQEQQEALQRAESREEELLREREKEAQVRRRQEDELRFLKDREARIRRDQEASDQRVKTLETGVEAERAAHLEAKFHSEVAQLRLRDLEAVLALERSGQQEAQRGLELLRAQLRESERALERLQEEYRQYKADLSVAVETERKMTSDLRSRLEQEERRSADTHTLLEQATQRQRDSDESFANTMSHIQETLRQHGGAGSCRPSAEDDGKCSRPADVLQLLRSTLRSLHLRLEAADRQVQDQQQTLEKVQEQNQTLRQLNSDQSTQLQESQQVSAGLQQEVTRLTQESSDWSTQSRRLQAELDREREDRTAEVQRIRGDHQEESQVRLSSLHCLYQRVLAGCVLLDESQSILGNFTWKELCDLISEQIDQQRSDLRRAHDEIAHLQSVCEKKSVCVVELQRSQQCVLSRVKEAWLKRHTHTVTQLHNELQVCASQRDSHREHASSLERRCSSLTSDLSRSRQDSASFLSGCALLGGALTDARRRLQALRQQKALLSRRLEEREALEGEVRSLLAALGGDEEETGRRREAARRWRRSVCVVLAARRWRLLSERNTVLFRVEVDGGESALCVRGDSTTAARKGEEEGGGGACARWLRSERLASAVLTSVADLQGALTRHDVVSASRSALSRLLDVLLDQSDATLSSGDGDSLRLCLSSGSPPLPDMKTLVSQLQQHFLLFSQRLHSAEVERRSLRLELANQKRELRQEKEGTSKTGPVERGGGGGGVWAELSQALGREQEAQSLMLQQSDQVKSLQEKVKELSAEQTTTRLSLSRTTQALAEARQEAGRKERSLRILGKHLSQVWKEKKQLEEELSGATRCRDHLKEAESKSLSDEPPITLSHTPSHTNPASCQQEPAPSSPLLKPARPKTKEKKAVKKTRGGRRQTDRK